MPRRRRRRQEPAAIALGLAVRLHRQRLGLTQEQVADRGDLHSTYVGRLERGLHNPSIAAVFQLAEGLGIKPEELIATARELIGECA